MNDLKLRNRVMGTCLLKKDVNGRNGWTEKGRKKAKKFKYLGVTISADDGMREEVSHSFRMEGKQCRRP